MSLERLQPNSFNYPLASTCKSVIPYSFSLQHPINLTSATWFSFSTPVPWMLGANQENHRAGQMRPSTASGSSTFAGPLHTTCFQPVRPPSQFPLADFLKLLHALTNQVLLALPARQPGGSSRTSLDPALRPQRQKALSCSPGPRPLASDPILSCPPPVPTPRLLLLSLRIHSACFSTDCFVSASKQAPLMLSFKFKSGHTLSLNTTPLLVAASPFSIHSDLRRGGVGGVYTRWLRLLTHFPGQRPSCYHVLPDIPQPPHMSWGTKRSRAINCPHFQGQVSG